jgi:serine/threonine-protein kinase RsbT
MPSLDAEQDIIHLVESADIVRARAKARHLATSLGFGPADQTRLATAVSELARNVLQYAGKGECIIEDIGTDEKIGIRIVFHDDGPGISNLELAMQDGYSTSGGLGAGLPGTQRLMDEFAVSSQPGNTRVTIAILRPRQLVSRRS